MPRHIRRILLALALLAAPSIAAAVSSRADAADVKVAVAANVTGPAQAIKQAFEAAHSHKLVMSFGATGQFYAQIAQGAPFEVFLAADKATPARAIMEGHAVPSTAFTYAIGKLVLYSRAPGLSLGAQTLKEGRFARIAIANPATAPYGAAALETLKALDVADALQAKIVQGNNIAQAFQFIETGNAELGFVALSQVARLEGGSRWIVPTDLHSPLAQDAVLLRQGAGSAAAKAFLDFLRSPEAIRIFATFGYATP